MIVFKVNHPKAGYFEIETHNGESLGMFHYSDEEGFRDWCRINKVTEIKESNFSHLSTVYGE